MFIKLIVDDIKAEFNELCPRGLPTLDSVFRYFLKNGHFNFTPQYLQNLAYDV